MRAFGVVLCAASALLLLPAAAPRSGASAAEPAAKQIVIVTGQDVIYHNWKKSAPVLKAELAKDRRLAVTVVEDLKFLDSPDLKHFDAVVMHFRNTSDRAGMKEYQNLEKFVRAGGGLMVVHWACAAFENIPDFVKLAGRVCNRKLHIHDPRRVFRVDIADREHPITKGLAPFETDDELYTCLDGTPSIHVLATAVSKVDNKPHPMAFILEYGKGRVFHTPLGHDARAIATKGTSELFRRGAAWIVHLDPAAAQ